MPDEKPNSKPSQQEMLEKIYKYSEEMHHYLVFRKVMLIFKVSIILVLIILGVVYIPQVISNLTSQYNQILNMSQQSQNLLDNLGNPQNGLDINGLIKSYLK